MRNQQNQARRETAIEEECDTAVLERQRCVDIYNNDVGGYACANTMTDGCLLWELTAYIHQIGESVFHIQHLPPTAASLSVGLDQSPTCPSILICGRGNLVVVSS